MVGLSTQPTTDATADNEMDVDYSSMDVDEPVDDDFMAINEPGSLSSSTLWDSLQCSQYPCAVYIPAEPNFAASKPARHSEVGQIEVVGSRGKGGAREKKAKVKEAEK
ncbi:hypothetical protein BYT27DRAFT_7253310 [Phlegmacium glaucopus]|nr:hypothetical protein BYT27DRAFT_7253310 [Phlegmacium glaucopus]